MLPTTAGEPNARLSGGEHGLGHAFQVVGDWAAGAGDQRALARGAILLLALLAGVGRAAGSRQYTWGSGCKPPWCCRVAVDISMGQTLKSLWNAATLLIHLASEGSPHSLSKLRLHQQGSGHGVSMRAVHELGSKQLSPDKVAKGPETLSFCPLLAPAKLLLQALHVVEAAAAALDAAADEGTGTEHRLRAAAIV